MGSDVITIAVIAVSCYFLYTGVGQALCKGGVHPRGLTQAGYGGGARGLQGRHPGGGHLPRCRHLQEVRQAAAHCSHQGVGYAHIYMNCMYIIYTPHWQLNWVKRYSMQREVMTEERGLIEMMFITVLHVNTNKLNTRQKVTLTTMKRSNHSNNTIMIHTYMHIVQYSEYIFIFLTPT